MRIIFPVDICIYVAIRLAIVCVLCCVFAVVAHADAVAVAVAGVVVDAAIDFMPLRALQARLTSIRLDSNKCFKRFNAQCVRSTVFTWLTLVHAAPPPAPYVEIFIGAVMLYDFKLPLFGFVLQMQQHTYTVVYKIYIYM